MDNVSLVNSEIRLKSFYPPPSIPPARGGKIKASPLTGGGQPARHREPLRRGGRGGGEIKSDYFRTFFEVIVRFKDNGQYSSTNS
jgi:hypothetical protein